MNTNRIEWSGEIGCEGGPVLVANLDDFQQWRGSEPFDQAEATELHFWSPFTDQLPQQWQPNGPNGHQYLACPYPAAQRELLMSVILEQWPGTLIDRSSDTWSATRPGGRTLKAALSPDSEYDRAIRNFETESIHHFGHDASAYLWEASPGMVRISVDITRNFLLLSQVEFADDEEGERLAHEHALGAGFDDTVSGAHYRITSGPVVVAWSPNSAGDLASPLSRSDAGPSLPGVLLDMSTCTSGALLWLEPGLYKSSAKYHKGESWAVSWCWLQRVDQ